MPTGYAQPLHSLEDLVIYNNLIYFLTAIFLFSLASVPVKPALSPFAAVLAFAAVVLVYDRYAARVFKKAATSHSADYFSAEKKVSIAALLVFALMIYGLDLKYYLDVFSFGEALPAFVNIAGLVVFLLLFTILWARARKSYQLVFARRYRPDTFIFSNLKANLPIVIPWIILTFCYDLVLFLELPWLQEIMATAWGDFIFFGSFLLFVIIFFPPLVRRLWGCKKLQAGPLHDHLVEFCHRQNFKADIYVWPLFEGRVITAGVMGILPGMRYILITPALVETMTTEELDSVMAHEIGHVKRFHLLLYVFLVAGFAVAVGLLAEPLFYLLFSRDFFYSFIGAIGLSPDAGRNLAVAVPTLVFLLLYFRYIFGFFMRNFERQADLHVHTVLGNSDAIISAFEKIAVLSGNIRDQPSWHHFGIGERVDFLQECERRPALIRRHHRKVRLSLLGYVLVMASVLLLVHAVPYEGAIADYEEKYIRADLLYDASQEEQPAHWLFFAGNFLLEHQYEKRAIIAFELAVEMDPDQPDLLNNFSWLLLTSKDLGLRDPEKALVLARRAAERKPVGHILDTLATALWANGYINEAVRTERQALLVDPEQEDYYRDQIEKFNSQNYQELVRDQARKEAEAVAETALEAVES